MEAGPGRRRAPEGGGRPKPFSIVVPFRDTPRGRAFAERSLPAAAALSPDEIMVGIDSPPAAGLEGFLRGAAGAAAPCRIVAVARSAEWAMHPAHVVHECFGRCSTGTALLYNIDTVLRPAVLGGLGMVGRDGVAAVSYSLRLLTHARAACP